MTWNYIRGEDNTVADALSRVRYGGKAQIESSLANHEVWRGLRPCGAVLTITADTDLLNEIRKGYRDDEYCKKLASCESFSSVKKVNGLWYIGGRLVVPHTGTIREDLFQLAHDTLGHFGAKKSYAALRDSYYWPNMRRDLELSYVLGCVHCQRNKSPTSKPKGPLHPLPVPEERGERVSLDFIGPLPKDEGYNCILSMTDALGSDIRIVPTATTVKAPEVADLFFSNWYCENGLPRDIVCDRDKIFVSSFWKALCKLTGVKLKMSSAYHPETDGSSERSNKTINQAIRYHVQRNQKGWVRALPLIRFQMMNSVNASTNYSGFQLKMGRSPRVIPALAVDETKRDFPDLAKAVDEVVPVLNRLHDDVEDAKDNLIAAKVSQTFHANKHRSKDDVYEVGDKVMLSTLNRRREYKNRDPDRVAKFMPRFDGPYIVSKRHAEFSTYTPDLPNHPNIFPTFHASELKRFVANDPVLFPSREDARPGPIVTADGQEEWVVEKIVDERRRGRGIQYLVKWVGYGDEENRWLPRREMLACTALDRWEEEKEGGSER
jgi:hypothetical protein